MKDLKSGLIIGQEYWIFDGIMKPFKAKLSHIVNNGRTAIFGGIARKTTSVYISHDQAIQENRY